MDNHPDVGAAMPKILQYKKSLILNMPERAEVLLTDGVIHFVEEEFLTIWKRILGNITQTYLYFGLPEHVCL